MRTILWIQNDSPEKKNTFLIDGEKSDYSGTPEQDNAFSLLVQGRHEEDPGRWKRMKKKMLNEHWWIAICSNIREFKDCERKKIGDILADNLQCYQDEKNFFLIQSCHKEKDVAGRRMPFMFYAATDNFEEACDLLKKSSYTVGRTCEEKELKFLKLILLKKKRNFRLICCVVMIILFIWIVITIF